MPDGQLRRPPRAPLYDPRFEHDACGVGFIAESGSGPSGRIIPLALQALAGLTHRGAIAGDAQTGDGAGIAIPLTTAHLTALARDAGLVLPRNRPAGLGMVFLPASDPERTIARELVEAAVAAEGLEPL